MIRIVARTVVQTYQKGEYLRLAKLLITESRKEAGCISYELYEDLHNPNVLTFMEEWSDQAAVDRHMATDHFRTLMSGIRPLCIGEPEIVMYHPADYK